VACKNPKFPDGLYFICVTLEKNIQDRKEEPMFRPYRNRQNWQMNLSPGQLATAMKANRFMNAGKTGEAAPLFANLAHEMEIAPHPRRAANLHAQAAHAFAGSGNESNALAQAKSALSLFIQYQMTERTSRFYTNITRKLSQRGMVNAALTLQKDFAGLAGPIPNNLSSAQRQPQGNLPPACTQCGAPLRSDEIDWVDDRTVECGYCGALIKTTV
jgi:hypothetical protein